MDFSVCSTSYSKCILVITTPSLSELLITTPPIAEALATMSNVHIVVFKDEAGKIIGRKLEEDVRCTRS